MKNVIKSLLIVASIILVSCTTSSSDQYSNNITLSTTAASSISTAAAVSGGNISSDGGASITTRGVCWSTSANPTIALSTKTTDGNGTGVFTSNLTGLSTNTAYHVRAYATNSFGTAYGTDFTFTTYNTSSPSVTDNDGNYYPLVTICNQTWTKTNLNVSHYRNGDVIPQVTNFVEWNDLTTGAWCYYNNDSANGPVYGKLYNWYAVNDPRGIAPDGYHIPSDAEWTALTNCVGGVNNGGALKETGTTHWIAPNEGATNTSGFTGLPGGGCYNHDPTFSYMGGGGLWWSSTQHSGLYAYYFQLDWSNSNAVIYSDFKKFGKSVRCVKD